MHDLNDLGYFAAVVEHGGFAAAERATGVPKSRLSRRIAALEARLGLRLLQRTTRRFAITEIGQELAQHARAMLTEAEAAEALAAEQSREPRGSVRLTCPPALLQHGVADLLAGFLRAWPRVQVQVESTNRNADVWHDGIDLALRARPAPAGHAPGRGDEIVRPLARSPHVLVAAPTLLAAAAPPATPRDLARLPTLGLGNSREERLWTLAGPEGAQAEVPHEPRLIANDMATLLCAALAGVGCAPLPRLLVHEALAQGRLIALLPGWAPPESLIQAAFASRRGMRPAARQLLDFLAQGFARLAAQGRCLAAV